jgi:uncharacterized membrane protein
MVITGSIMYLFLLWNLFLAFVPYAISEWMDKWPPPGRFRLIGIISTWLLFMPNTFYILTDLFHLDEKTTVPKWFDLLLLLSFAWNGLLFGIASLRKMERIIQRVSGKGFPLLVVFSVMWLNAFGIYIGRYLRFNSWDIIAKPFALMTDMVEILCHPLRYKMEWGMIAGYAVFMTLLYTTIKKLAESFSQLNTQQIKTN